jgi:ABC-2 type transport system permease protein
MWPLYQKELKEYFNSPLVYILSAIFILISGWLFFNYILAAKDPTTESLTTSVVIPTFGNINLIFLFFSPLITMRVFAEEKKSKTLELLFLSNLSDEQIILAKLLGALTVGAFMMALTVVFPLILYFSGYREIGIILTGYLGIFMCILCYISVGIFTSSLAQNQIIAAILSFAFLMGFMLMVLSVNASELSFTREILGYMSVPFHLEGFVFGSLRSFSFVYFGSFLGFFFFLTKKSLESRYW